MTQTVQHEPCGFLGYVNVLRELRAGNSFLVRRDEPNGRKPLAQRNFAVLENGADADRKPITALGTFPSLAVLEGVELVVAAVGTELAVPPADRLEIADCGLFVRDRLEQFVEALELGFHGSPLPSVSFGAYTTFWAGSSRYIISGFTRLAHSKRPKSGRPDFGWSIHLRKDFCQADGLPGHKRVHARLRRAMPGNDAAMLD